jgi:hypothetical protein
MVDLTIANTTNTTTYTIYIPTDECADYVTERPNWAEDGNGAGSIMHKSARLNKVKRSFIVENTKNISNVNPSEDYPQWRMENGRYGVLIDKNQQYLQWSSAYTGVSHTYTHDGQRNNLPPITWRKFNRPFSTSWKNPKRTPVERNTYSLGQWDYAPTAAGPWGTSNVLGGGAMPLSAAWRGINLQLPGTAPQQFLNEVTGLETGDSTLYYNNFPAAAKYIPQILFYFETPPHTTTTYRWKKLYSTDITVYGCRSVDVAGLAN